MIAGNRNSVMNDLSRDTDNAWGAHFTGAIIGDGESGVGSIDEIPAWVIGDPMGGSGGGGIIVPPARPYTPEPRNQPRIKDSKATDKTRG